MPYQLPGSARSLRQLFRLFFLLFFFFFRVVLRSRAGGDDQDRVEICPLLHARHRDRRARLVDQARSDQLCRATPTCALRRRVQQLKKSFWIGFHDFSLLSRSLDKALEVCGRNLARLNVMLCDAADGTWLERIAQCCPNLTERHLHDSSHGGEKKKDAYRVVQHSIFFFGFFVL